MGKILVWDWPVRIGHWLLAGAFALAWLTGDSEEWRLVHAYAGGTVVGVILFRLIWGLVGTYHARFTSFVRGPGGVLGYLRGLLAGRPAHTAGHNPAGGWAIVGLLTLGLLAGGSGWLVYQDIADLEEAVSGPKRKVTTFDSSCFTGEYVTGIEPGYFERLQQLRSDEAKRKQRVG